MGWNNIPPNGFPQIPDIEDLEAVVNDVAGLKTGKVNKVDIAPAFSAEGNYSVGDLVYYEGTLYKCTTAHEAAAWNAEHFTATTIEAEIAELQGDVSDLGTTKANQITIAPTFSAETAYEAGDIVYYNGLTYRCTNDHEGAWDAADFSATTIAGELASLKSGLIEKVDQLTLVESSSQSDDDAIKNLFDDINIYDKPIVGAMGFQSWWVYIAYKYTDGNYGCIVAYRFDGTAKFLSVNAGVKTIKSFAFSS